MKCKPSDRLPLSDCGRLVTLPELACYPIPDKVKANIVWGEGEVGVIRSAFNTF